MRQIGLWRGLAWLAACGSLQAEQAPAARRELPETPLFQTFGPSEGLPSSSVRAVRQDRDGYLWIATSDGLARYDGVRFEVHRHDPAQAGSLPSNNIQALHVDAANRLWIGAEGGGLSMLGASRRGRFEHLQRGRSELMRADDVWAIESTADGALWFGGYRSGLHRLADPAALADSASLQRMDAAGGGLPDDTVLAMVAAPEGGLFVGTARGVARVDGDGIQPLDAAFTDVVVSLHVEPDQTLWVGTMDGLRVLRPGADALERVDGRHAPFGTTTAVLRDSPGHLWVGSRDGLHRLAGDSWQHHRPSPGRRWALPNGQIEALFADHEGGLWAATLSGGLARLPPNWRNFSVFPPRTSDLPGLSGDAPRGIAAALDGGLWVVGVDTELDHVDLATGTVTSHPQAVESLPNRRLYSVLQTTDGAVWIGHHTGLLRLDAELRAQQHWTAESDDAIPPGYVDQLIAADSGFWLSSQGGGLQFRDLQGRVISEFRRGRAGLPGADTEQIALDDAGTLWWAGAQGLFKLDSQRQQFHRVPGSPEERVYSFAFGPEGDLWLHRLGALQRFRRSDGGLVELDRIDVRAGLPAVESGGLSRDRRGDIWLTTARGLFRYRPDSSDGLAELRAYGVRDGLPSQEFYNRPPLTLADGVVAALTRSGLVVFDPGRLAQQQSASPLHWQQLSVRRDGAALELPPGPIELHHDDREFRVGARLLSFAEPAANRYRFRLEGFDPGWIDSGNLGERVYPQLPPGQYSLQVTAANADGVWVQPPLQLPLKVLPPWWLTGGAVLLMVLAGLALLWLLAWRYRARVARRHAAELAETQRVWALEASEAKSRFLAMLGHEIRTPMTGVLGMTELLQQTALDARQRHYTEAIERSGAIMLQLVNDALDLARVEAGRLELALETVDLHKLLRNVAELQQPLARRKALEFELQIEHDAPRHVQADALRLQQILLNLCGNAIKFTARGGVRLELAAAAAPMTAAISIIDTGPGLDAAQQARLFQRFAQADGAETTRRHGGSGLGLAVSSEFARAMGGDIAVDSAPGKGCCFRVLLPLPPADAPAARPEPQAAVSHAGRVLLVEDDPTVAEVIGGLLQAIGCEVTHVTHALGALAAVAEHDPGVAFLDLDLPDVDGLQLAEMLRASHPQLVLIALTARADAAAERDAHAAGMQLFLRKPVTLQTLRDALQKTGASCS